MSIKIDEQIKEELETLKQWLQKRDESWVQDNQEIILTTVYLLKNIEFKKEINSLRKIHKVPEKWHSARKREDSIYEEWWEFIENKKPTPPFTIMDREIIEICKKYKVNHKRYGNFVIEYLYFGDATPIRDYYYLNFNARGEYRYKARIELDFGEGMYDVPTNTPQKGYIRFFKDTTKNRLIKFIKENWDNIKQIQSNLQPYPHSRKFGSFKRDIQIYLIHLLGKKPDEIIEQVKKENIPNYETLDMYELEKLEKPYDLGENAVYELIKDIDKRIRSIRE